MSLNVLILGANGMLGHMLCRKLADKFTVSASVRNTSEPFKNILPQTLTLHEGADVCHLPSVIALLEKTQPDVVINCVGVIKQADEVVDVSRMYHINAFFPQQLAAVAKERGIKVIHFSTDCVFDGQKGAPYEVDDTPTAQDDYGKSKFLGELHAEHTLTLRTSIIGRELSRHKSLIDWFISQKGQQIKGYNRALYSGVTTLEMAFIVQYLLENKPDLHGVYQVASQAISKFDLLRCLNSLMNHGTKIDSCDDFVCDRRLNGSSFEKASGYTINSWDDMLKAFVEDNAYNEK